MTNMKMWPKSTIPSIEPPEITHMPGRPRKKRSKDSDEPSKKKFGKATRKWRKTKCSLCRNFGHNKKECPIAKNGYTTGIARTATGGSGAATTSVASTGVTGRATSESGATTGGNGGATISAASTGVTTSGNGGATTNRPATTLATSGGATSAATTTGGRAANISVNFASVAQQTSQFSTQQSTTSASGSKKSSKVKKEKPRTTGFGVLFGANGSVIERFGTTDRVLHCAPLKSSVPTNIDLGYKPNGLRWKGGAAVTQRQLQEQSYKRATQSTPSTQDT
ncbi:uncharacterized protein LOC125843196 [Solanum stenotomum]|uniref:uncharacterized protein LOC125843196 n=1 Tax=Solanum stenotomum TaxID=172797 RepID=UPI0020D1D357|nr:uncharacterized protein LOC125843196 [Solanum stenotomum]